ncbi:hypothetical protein ES703_115598 [subsurface metagenome]
MKFCYLDESGTGNEPYAVMAGIIVDTERMRPTKKDWIELLSLLSEIIKRPIPEFHTSVFYSGNGKWHKKISGDDRARIIEVIFRWIIDRKHKIVYSAVNKDKFNSDFKNETYYNDVKTLWRFMALHICLAIQKSQQSYKGFKGRTMLIFDNAEREKKYFIELIKNPPIWTDSYYNRKRKQERLDQILDIPYFTDSKHVGLIQLADFISFFLRRYVELQQGVKSDYEDEQDKIALWGDIALSQSISPAAIYPSIGRCECANFFYRYAPACLQR